MKDRDFTVTDAHVKALMKSSCWPSIEAFVRLKQSLRTHRQKSDLDMLWPCVKREALACGFQDPVIGAAMRVAAGEIPKPK